MTEASERSQTPLQNQLSWRLDPWLTEIFGRRVLAGSLGTKPETTEAAVPDALASDERASFAFIKIAAETPAWVSTLSQSGFYLSDTSLLFSKSLPNQALPGQIQLPDHLEMGWARGDEREAIGALASRSFRFSRFHLDPCIQSELADRIKREWTLNFFAGKRGTRLAVARTPAGPVGYVLLLEPPGRWVIDLIAVSPESQGQGIGRLLLAFVESEAAAAGGVRELQVGTQLINQPSVKLYQRFGFTLSRAEYVLHRFKENTL